MLSNYLQRENCIVIIKIITSCVMGVYTYVHPRVRVFVCVCVCVCIFCYLNIYIATFDKIFCFF